MSDEEWVPSAEEEEGDTSPPKSRPKRSLVRPANYANEKQDDFFVGVKGYTNFHRTRKGGDRRPCSAQRPVFLLPALLSIQRMHTCLAFHTHACRRSWRNVCQRHYFIILSPRILRNQKKKKCPIIKMCKHRQWQEKTRWEHVPINMPDRPKACPS